MKAQPLYSTIPSERARRNHHRCKATLLVMTLLIGFSDAAYAQHTVKSLANYRGPQVAGTSMSNVHLKSSETVSPSHATYISWKAPRSGRIKEFWGWFKTDNKRGYSGGNRGTYTISIRPDLEGLPALKVLAEKRKISKFTDNDTSNNLRHIVFKRAPRIVAGRTYHFVISNTDQNPSENWLSLNTVFASNDRRDVSRPTNNNDLSFAFHGARGNYETGMPTWVVGIDENDDGTSDIFSGNPYVGAFSHFGDAAPRTRPISGSRITRIGYPVPAGEGHTVKRVAVAAYRIAGSAPLKVSLVDGAGVILSKAEIPGSAYPSFAQSGGKDVLMWGDGAFKPKVAVEPNKPYFLQFHTDEDTVYFPVALQDSADTYGGPAEMTGLYGGWFGLSAFAEHSVDNGATWERYSLTNSKHGSYIHPSKKWDLSFYVVTD